MNCVVRVKAEVDRKTLGMADAGRMTRILALLTTRPSEERLSLKSWSKRLRIKATKRVAWHLIRGFPGGARPPYSVDYATAKKCRNPTILFSCDVTCHIVWALKFRPRLHFAWNYMKLSIPFSLIPRNHGTTRQCNRPEDHKTVPEATKSRSIIRFLLQHSTDQQRDTPSGIAVPPLGLTAGSATLDRWSHCSISCCAESRPQALSDKTVLVQRTNAL